MGGWLPPPPTLSSLEAVSETAPQRNLNRAGAHGVVGILYVKVMRHSTGSLSSESESSALSPGSPLGDETLKESCSYRNLMGRSDT